VCRSEAQADSAVSRRSRGQHNMHLCRAQGVHSLEKEYATPQDALNCATRVKTHASDLNSVHPENYIDVVPVSGSLINGSVDNAGLTHSDTHPYELHNDERNANALCVVLHTVCIHRVVIAM
jgi:hypothetical protein